MARHASLCSFEFDLGHNGRAELAHALAARIARCAARRLPQEARSGAGAESEAAAWAAAAADVAACQAAALEGMRRLFEEASAALAKAAPGMMPEEPLLPFFPASAVARRVLPRLGALGQVAGLPPALAGCHVLPVSRPWGTPAYDSNDSSAKDSSALANDSALAKDSAGRHVSPDRVVVVSQSLAAESLTESQLRADLEHAAGEMARLALRLRVAEEALASERGRLQCACGGSVGGGWAEGMETSSIPRGGLGKGPRQVEAEVGKWRAAAAAAEARA